MRPLFQRNFRYSHVREHARVALYMCLHVSLRVTCIAFSAKRIMRSQQADSSGSIVAPIQAKRVVLCQANVYKLLARACTSDNGTRAGMHARITGSERYADVSSGAMARHQASANRIGGGEIAHTPPEACRRAGEEKTRSCGRRTTELRALRLQLRAFRACSTHTHIGAVCHATRSGGRMLARTVTGSL